MTSYEISWLDFKTHQYNLMFWREVRKIFRGKRKTLRTHRTGAREKKFSFSR